MDPADRRGGCLPSATTARASGTAEQVRAFIKEMSICGPPVSLVNRRHAERFCLAAFEWELAVAGLRRKKSHGEGFLAVAL
ncbi:MAG: hypothetical protein ACRD88_09410 [Terriglobia bacterium]